MSISIAHNELSQSKREEIIDDIKVEQIIKTMNGVRTVSHYPYEMNDTHVFLPFFYSVTTLKRHIPPKSAYTEINCPFEGKLRPYQKKIKNEVVAQLNKTHCALLAAYTGCGKTAMSIYLASKIKLKTLIVISRLVLINQWKDSIQKFLPSAIVQVLKTKTKIKPEADFYIMNALNIPKRGMNAFSDVGFLIVDEVHLIATKILSQSLSYVTPCFTLALSATPTRSDGMDKIIHLYYGKDIIYKKLERKHTVFKIDTEFKPNYTLNNIGRMNWDSVLQAQAKNIPRNEIIINIVKAFKERYFLILCKRVSHVEHLLKRFTEEKVDATYLVGTKVQYNLQSKVLIATIQKCGVGFDHPKLDSLILAADVKEYFIQYLGRVMRRQDVEPYIFDLVDDNSVLKKHYYDRRKIYKNHGGIFQSFSKTYPKIKLKI